MSVSIRAGLFTILISATAIPAMANDSAAPSPITFLMTEMANEKQVQTLGNLQSTQAAGTLGSQPSVNASKSNAETVNALKSSNNRNVDHLHYPMGRNKTRSVAMDAKLIATYGQPDIQRGSLKVWEMNNVEFGIGQSRQITVTSGEDDSGYFVSVDRRGVSPGNNPRLKVKKVTPSKPEQTTIYTPPQRPKSIGRPAVSDR